MPHQKEKIYLNALNLAFQDNFLQLAAILKPYPSYAQAWRKISSLQHIPLSPQQAWEKLEKSKIKFVLPSEKEYPFLLKEISVPPRGLYYQGNFFPEMIPLAVVGTRKISNYGKTVAKKIVQELVRYNFIIVSGLAEGVDTIAHQTALKNGGRTIAILGSGLDNIYPASNQKLAQQIIQMGAVVSEYPLGTLPHRSNFPCRNRIISGLSWGTLVIEAPIKSGALITANFALEQNREVFAIPGPVFQLNSQGTNRLIQEGAKLVININDILKELNIPPSLPIKKQLSFLKKKEKD